MRESRKPPSFKRAKPEDSNESSGFLLVVGRRALSSLCGIWPYACFKVYVLMLAARCMVLYLLEGVRSYLL